MSREGKTHDKERENFLYRVDCSTKHEAQDRLHPKTQSHCLPSTDLIGEITT